MIIKDEIKRVQNVMKNHHGFTPTLEMIELASIKKMTDLIGRELPNNIHDCQAMVDGIRELRNEPKTSKEVKTVSKTTGKTSGSKPGSAALS